MSKSKKKEVSKGRNFDLMEMFANPSGAGPHRNKRDRRKSNPKNHWRSNDQEQY